MMLATLSVAIRIVANPVANAFQKRLTAAPANPLFIIAATHALLTLVVLPPLARAPLSSIGITFWANMAISATLAVAGNTLLVYALRAGELSVLGSINAYKAVVSLVLGIFLVGEVPNAAGLIGVLLILAGSAIVVEQPTADTNGSTTTDAHGCTRIVEGHSRRGVFVRFFRAPGVSLRFAALACSATEAVFLKRAVLDASPVMVFYIWATFGLLVSVPCVIVVLRGDVRSELHTFHRHSRTYIWLAAATGVMQLTTLMTFGVMPVGYSLALFQLSTLISVFLGYRYFEERSIARRLIGSIVMIAGAVMIAAVGRSG